MASTLEACFSSSEESALKLISEKEKQVEAAEGESQEQRTRVDAERAIEFYEELESDKFSKIAPAIMQSFHSHGDECARVETQALELALQGPADPNEDDPLQVYYDMLDNLDKLYKEARDLESKIVDFTSAFKGGATQTGPAEDTDIPSARSRILDVVTACLPVISARKSNLSMAQELIDSAQENCSITLRMESLGIE
ncbi:hypothetical protein FA15DRAFT_361973 [Coprinopsis marcescibilis]|uniref:Uncharacterized protein n=1 Tax=Coprinopsis marcescibilis TaxID=230819 RepID=A0A5C3KBU1_COPMA|nr:hypothetical protein FA15DRAFT_361973 [Coprinopsis marcescibilis]